MTRKTPKAPKYLTAPTRHWSGAVAAEYVLESHHLRLLELAARSWDRAEEARVLLKKDGLTTVDRYGQLKPNPLVNVERDSQLRFARLLRELALDLEPPVSARVPRTGGQA